MAKFPVDPVPQYPLQITQNWKTIISTFDGGQEQRRRKLDFPTYDVTLTFAALTQDEIDALWNFYNSMGGAYEEFYFFVPYVESHKRLYVCTGTGTITNTYNLKTAAGEYLKTATGDQLILTIAIPFDVPGIVDGAFHLYFDNVERTYGYTLVSGGGGGGADRIMFTTLPGQGVVVSCDLVGYQRIICRFAEDKMTKERFEAAIFKTGLNLKGLYEI